MHSVSVCANGAMMSCCVKCFSQRQWEQITGAVSSYRLRAPHFIPTDFLFPSSSSSSLAILDAVWLPAGGCCHCFLFCCLSILIRVVYAHCSSCHCALTSVPTWCASLHRHTHTRPFHVGRFLGDNWYGPWTSSYMSFKCVVLDSERFS